MSSTLRTTPSGELDLSQIDFDWVTSCKNARDLQRVVDALEHEPYPQLLEQAKKKLFELNPKLSPPSFQPASRDEVQTAIRELDEWIDSTKAKDALFSAAKNQATPAPIRPIRGSTDTSTSTSTPSSTSTNPSIAAEQNRISSQREKEKGNECYKSREYLDAITSYTKAMNLSSEDITLYTNRAMAYFKLKRYDEMIQDCNTAISRDNNNFKAYWRRGMGYGALLKWKEAIKDYTRALELSPGHAEISKLLKEARSHESDPAPSSAPSTSTQFKRMTITEVDDDDEDDGDEEKEQKQKSEADTAPLTASQKKNARKRAKKKAANAATTATPAEPMKRIQVVEDDDEDDQDDNADDVESVPINVKKSEPTTAKHATTTAPTPAPAASKSTPASTSTPAAPVSLATATTSASASLTPSIPALTAAEESKLTPALAAAEAHKARGNALYSSGSHELAIEAYTAAIKALPTETTGIYASRAVQSKISSAYATYHSNRAACRQQIGQHKEAISDCTVAIDITRPFHIASTSTSTSSSRAPAPNTALYIKSLLRRAFAYETIDSMAASLTDMEAVLAVDPSVVVAQQGKHRLSKSVNQERAYAMRDGKDNGNKHFGLGAWQAAIDAYTRGIQAYDQLTSQALSTSKEHLLTLTQLLTNRALSYIKLKSYDQARADCDRVLQQGTVDADVVMRAKAHYRRGLALVGLGNHRAAVTDLEAANKLQPSDAITAELTKARAAAEKQPKATAPTSAPASTTSKSKIQVVDQTPTTTPPESKSTTPATKSTSNSSSTSSSTTSAPPSPSLPPPPKSFFQWESAFRQLSAHPDVFHQYLLSIPPNAFSSLFKSTSDTLNADMIDKIVAVCDKYMKNSDPSRVADLLSRMCGVHRFSLTRSMLSAETFVTLRSMIPTLASKGVPQATIQNLKAKYGLE